MYEEHFGFMEKPFAQDPDPDVLYLSTTHAKALQHLQGGITDQPGLCLLTGQAGTGKTALIRHLLKTRPFEGPIGLINLTERGSGELIKEILGVFELGPEASDYAHNLNLLEVFFRGCHFRGQRAVLIVDEAQHLNQKALEELRLLSSIRCEGHVLLRIVLIAQPDIWQRLESSELEHVPQRIGAVYQLQPLSQKETAEYVNYRIHRVGDPEAQLFQSQALQGIFEFSKGIPREINAVCEASLVAGYVAEASTISREVLERAVQDLRMQKSAEEGELESGQNQFPDGAEVHCRDIPEQDNDAGFLEQRCDALKSDRSGQSLSHSSGAIQEDEGARTSGVADQVGRADFQRASVRELLQGLRMSCEELVQYVNEDERCRPSSDASAQANLASLKDRVRHLIEQLSCLEIRLSAAPKGGYGCDTAQHSPHHSRRVQLFSTNGAYQSQNGAEKLPVSHRFGSLSRREASMEHVQDQSSSKSLALTSLRQDTRAGRESSPGSRASEGEAGKEGQRPRKNLSGFMKGVLTLTGLVVVFQLLMLQFVFFRG